MFCSRQIKRKINHIHERALRMVYDDYVSSFNELLIKDGSVSIHHRNIQYVAIVMYIAMNSLCPSIMKDILGGGKISANRSGNTFARPKVTTVYKGENSLRIFGPIVWNNMLPNKFKSCSTLIEFKTLIRKNL